MLGRGSKQGAGGFVERGAARLGFEASDARPNDAVTAEIVIPAPQPVVFSFISNLDNHPKFDTEGMRVAALDGPEGGRVGGRMVLSTPWGRWEANVRVSQVEPPRTLVGSAHTGRSTADIIWQLQPDPDGTRVSLSIVLGKTSAMDRAILKTGGRRWLRSQLRKILQAVLRAGAEAGRQVPAGQVPGGQVPGGQVPGGQVPGGQAPVSGQEPGGQEPEQSAGQAWQAPG